MVSSDKSLTNFPFKKLRVIPYQEFSGVQNMALDLLFANQVDKTNVPILRFYGWKPYCLSLGYHQKTEDIDLQKLINDGFDIVKRPTGGSAIFHSEELTYSFIIPKTTYYHHELYEMFHCNLAQALTQLGFDVSLSSDNNPGSYLNQGSDTFACFNRAAKSEIKYHGKKIVGSAQKIFNKSILQHGSIILGRKHEEIVSFLKVESSEKKKQEIYLKKHAISLNEINNKKVSIFSIADVMVSCLCNSLKINNIFYKYTESNELKLAKSFYDIVTVVN